MFARIVLLLDTQVGRTLVRKLSILSHYSGETICIYTIVLSVIQQDGSLYAHTRNKRARWKISSVHFWSIVLIHGLVITDIGVILSYIIVLLQNKIKSIVFRSNIYQSQRDIMFCNITLSSTRTTAQLYMLYV